MSQPEGNKGMVYFAGAGPGDVELLTLKAQRLISQADVLLYAGSLIPPEMLQFARLDAVCLDTSKMKLEDQLSCMTEAAGSGKLVVRLHTGDPSLFGAIHEQMAGLRDAGVSYEIVPGVSSAFAAAAALQMELTVPEVTQTAIFTRLGGRTSVPESERLRGLAAHHASLVIFLSTGMAAEVADELAAAGYPAQTPVAVVYRASWQDEIIVHTTLAQMADKLQSMEMTHQALIIVSPALHTVPGQNRTRSHLYGKALESPAYRENACAILCLTRQATALGERLLSQFEDAHLYTPRRFLTPERLSCKRVYPFQVSIRQVLHEAFIRYDALICIMASGLVIRELAPLLKNKHTDAGVVVMDAAGRYAVSLLGGHAGGANELARRAAAALGAEAVITTASDVNRLPALDLLGRAEGWKLEGEQHMTALMACLVNQESVAVYQDAGDEAWWEDNDTSGLLRCRSLSELAGAGAEVMLAITPRLLPEAVVQRVPAVIYRPPCLAAGVGCRRGTSCDEILKSIDAALHAAGFSAASVAWLASVEDKKDEAGLLEACRRRGWELKIYSRDEINAVAHAPEVSSAAQRALGIWGVAEPCAMLSAGSRRLLVEKRKFAAVTVAAAGIVGRWREA